MSYRNTAALLAAGTALTASWALPIAAQTVPAPATAAPTPQSSADGIQDIIVTAQRRAQSLQQGSRSKALRARHASDKPFAFSATKTPEVVS